MPEVQPSKDNIYTIGGATESSVPDSKAALNEVLAYVQQTKANVDLYVGKYFDPRQKSPQIASVSTQTLGSVPIFGSGAAVIPVENLDKSFLIAQQNLAHAKEREAATMGYVAPYVKLVNAAANDRFLAAQNNMYQSAYNKYLNDFADKTNAPELARKAVKYDLNLQANMASFSGAADQFNTLYPKVLDTLSQADKGSIFLTKNDRQTLQTFINAPEDILKSGTTDLNGFNKVMNYVQTKIVPLAPLSVSVKTYVDELGQKVTESLSKDVAWRTSAADMKLLVKKTMMANNDPESIARNIMVSSYPSIDPNSEEYKDIVSRLKPVIADQLTTKVETTTAALSNNIWERERWTMEQKQKATTWNNGTLGYTTFSGGKHTLDVQTLPTNQKPFTYAISGGTVLLDKNTGNYIRIPSSVNADVSVKGIHSMSMQISNSDGSAASAQHKMNEGLLAMSILGGDAKNPYNGMASRVSGAAAEVILSPSKGDQQTYNTKMGTTTMHSTEPLTADVEVWDSKAQRWIKKPKYNLGEGSYLISARTVVAPTRGVDDKLDAYFNMGGTLPPTEQTAAKQKPSMYK